MRIPILSNRTERRQAALEAAINAGVEKALVAQAPAGTTGISGATYVPNPSSPFTQSGGSFGYNPLPRPLGEFDSGFGPAFPLIPSAIDPLRPDGRADPRRYQYQVAENVQLGQYGAPWTLLRRIATEVDVVARCIELVQDAIAGMSWNWSFSRQIINQIRMENNEPNSAKATALAREKYGTELTRVQQFFERPDEKMGYNFSQWLSLAVYASLVYDGVVVAPSYTLKGDLHSLSLLDTSCYSDDTEVLTDRGWKLFKDCDIQIDRFATRNQETRAFEWQWASDYYEGPFMGDLYHFSSRTLDVLVTPNHRMLVTDGKRERLIRADELAATYTPGLTALPAVSEWTAPDLATFTFVRQSKHANIPNLDKWIRRYEDGEPAYSLAREAGIGTNTLATAMLMQGVELRGHGGKPSGAQWLREQQRMSAEARTFQWSGDDFAAFMGMYLSEGSLGSLNGDATGTRHGKGNARMVVISQQETSKGYHEFKSLLERLPGITPWRDDNTWRFGCKAVADYLRPLGHSWEKYIPAEILSMSRRQLEIFWRFYMLGDGCYGHNGETISTVSRRMADGLQEVAQKIGYSSAVRTYGPRADCVMRDGRVIKQENQRTRYCIKLRTSKTQRFSVDKVSYSGNVYCVTVPNHVIYVRRGGQPIWCGQTIKILLDNHGFLPAPPAPAYQQVLWGFARSEFQAEERDDGVVPNGYRQDQLAYFIRRPRLHTPYGYSTVEECINYATLYQARQQWLHAEWSHGVTPKLAIETSGVENWTPEQYGYFAQALNDQWSGQTQRRQQAMVLMPGMKPTQLHELAELYTGDLDSYLVLQIGSKFGVPQSQLGIPMNIRSISTSNIGGQAQMDLTDKFALDALVNFLVNCTNDLARRFLGIGPEITITAAQGNSNDADLASAQADASDVDHGIRTRNEVRAERGIPLISDPEADQLGITSATGVTFLTGTLQAQEAQLAILESRGGVPAEGRQRSSRSDEPADPDAKPTAALPRKADTPHKSRNEPVQPDVTPRVSGAQQGHTDAGSYTEKELQAFTKFAKSRMTRGTWRDFEFSELDAVPAALLNAHGNDNDPIALAELTDLIKDGVCTGPGPCVTTEIGPGPNWVTRVEGLPKYIRAIAHALLRSGYGEAQAIATAVATVKRWASGSGKVTEATRARAAAAAQEWEDKKAAVHEAHGKSVGPVAAGIAVRAEDSGRILLLQRSVDDDDDVAAGKWELPGGHIEPGETSYQAATREFAEEVGLDLPDGTVTTSYLSPNGNYEAFIYVIANESDIPINDQGTDRASDPDGDGCETIAWWDIDDMRGSSAMRSEMRLTPFDLLES